MLDIKKTKLSNNQGKLKIGVCGGTRYFSKGGSATISSPGKYRYSDSYYYCECNN